MTVAAGVMTASCDTFDEDLDPCPQGIELRFIYDYNMEYANAFPSQVDCLTVLVYNSAGKLVRVLTETSDVLSDENWRMQVDLPAGQYRVIAYGGMACDKPSFTFTEALEPGLEMTKLGVDMLSSMLTSPVGQNLHPLFWGDCELTVTEDDTEYSRGTVEMMKDTNNVRVVLQNVDGTPVDQNDYVFTLTDDNTRFNWDNELLESPTVTYWPWTRGNATAGFTEEGLEVKAAYAEFSTSRFVTDSPAQLTVTRKSDGRKVLSIPLIRTLLLLRSEAYAKMESQEFLDRESRWNLLFLLDSTTGGWIKTSIVINDWEVRINDISDM